VRIRYNLCVEVEHFLTASGVFLSISRAARRLARKPKENNRSGASLHNGSARSVQSAIRSNPVRFWAEN